MTSQEKKLAAKVARYVAERRFQDVLSTKPGFYQNEQGRVVYKHPLYEIVNAKNLKHRGGPA